MCRRLIFLTCLVFVLSMAGNASADLVGHWTLDEGSGTIAYDSSGNGNDGTFEGDPQWVPGRSGTALEFDGDDWVNFGTPAELVINGPISITCWINPGALGGNQSQRGFVGLDGGYSLKANGTGVRFTTPGILDHSSSNITLEVAAWQHVAATFQPGQGEGLIFYLNGVETERMTSSAMNAGGGPFRIGNNQWSETYTGLIDDVRVYNHILTEGEVLAAMEGGKGYPYALGPVPADGALYPDVWASLGWKAGDFAVSHNVYMGTNFADVDAGTGDTFIGNVPENYVSDPYQIVGFQGFPFPDGLVPGTTYYWRVDEVNDMDPNSPWKGNVWSFSIPPKKAYDPVPGDGEWFVDTDVTLTWTVGFGARTHTVYFGDDFDTVNDATTGGVPTPFATYTPPAPLEPEKTYYWRVDETDDVFVTYEGDVWSFKTAKAGGGVKAEYYHHDGATPHSPPAAAFDTLVLTRTDPQINFNWASGSPDASINVEDFSVIWTGEVQAVHTETYTFYTNTDDGVMLWVNGELLIDNWTDHAPTEDRGTIDLVSGQHYPIEMWFYERGGGAVAELRWSSAGTPKQFVPQGALSPPMRAGSPNPPNGSTGAKMTPVLSWNPGDFAAEHRVFFGTDDDAVKNATTASPEYKDTRVLGDESFEPGKLAWDSTYYWRIDEVNNLHPDSPWVGSVWSFTTGDFFVVDNFEEYDVDNAIWANWLDGLGYVDGDGVTHAGNGSGSEVGDSTTPSYTEETIVHGGSQSMPYWYNNSGSTGKLNYSEAKLTLSNTRDWTEEDVKGLSLWFYGDSANAPEQMYVAVANNTGDPVVVPYGGDAGDLRRATWQEWNIDLREFSNAGLNLADVNSIAIGFGNRDNPQIGGTGKVYFDDIRLYRTRCVSSLLKPDADLSGNCVVDIADVEIMANNWLISTFQVDPADPGTANLVGHWTFDNPADLGADSTGNNNGTISGEASQSANAQVGSGSLALDGDGDFINVAGGDFFSALDDDGDGLSVAAWVRFAPRGQYTLMRVFSTNMSGGGSGGWGFGIIQPPARLRFTTYGIQDYDTGDLSSHLPDGQWVHVAAVYKSDGDVDFYIDGAQAETITGNFSMNDTQGFLIGGLAAATATEWFEGLIDDLRIYDRELSLGEVGWLAGKTAPYLHDISYLLTPQDPAINAHDDGVIDLRDFAVLADQWLDELVWPQP